MRKAAGILSILGLLTIASPAFSAPPGPQPKSFDLIRWNGGKFIYGVDYYPEAWSESQDRKSTRLNSSHRL